MLIGVDKCDWKCCKEAKQDICQNMEIAKQLSKAIPIDNIIKKYLTDNITSAIIFGGLEPFLQFNELYSFIYTLRNKYNCNDDVVIYTGYYENEIQEQVNKLKEFSNIIIKFGRFVPNDTKHFDNVLGINLASSNQYSVKIS